MGVDHRAIVTPERVKLVNFDRLTIRVKIESAYQELSLQYR